MPTETMSRSTFDTTFSSAHPLLLSLESCSASGEILTALREQIPGFDQPQGGNDSDNLTKLLAPMANILFAFSVTLGEGIGPVHVIFRRRRPVVGLCFLRFSALSQNIVTPLCSRPLKTLVLAKPFLFISSTASNVSSYDSKFIPRLHRLQL
jgi:hypothetical protein